MRKAFLSGALALLIAQGVFVLSGYAVHVGLGRLLGPGNYGTYGVVISLVAIINLVFVGGIQTAVSKFVSQTRAGPEAIKAGALKLALIISLFIAVIYFFSAPLIAAALSDTSLVPLIQLSAFIIPTYALYPVFLGYFNGLRRYGRQSLVSISYSFSKASFILALALLGFSVGGAIVGFALAPLIALAIGLFLSPLGKSKEGFDSIKLLSLGVLVTLFSLCFKVATLTGLFMVKSLMVQSVFAGYYNAAFQISNLPYVFSIALTCVIFPIVSHSVSHETLEETRKHFLSALRYFLVLILPAALFISVFSTQLISLLFTPKYLPGAAALAILGIASIFISLFSLLSFVLIAANRHKLTLFNALVVLLFSFPLNWQLVPAYGIEGAALATLFAFAIGSLIAAKAVWSALRA